MVKICKRSIGRIMLVERRCMPLLSFFLLYCARTHTLHTTLHSHTMLCVSWSKELFPNSRLLRLLNYFEDQHFRTYKFFIIPKFYLKHNAYNARCLNLTASQSLCYNLSSFALLLYRQNKQNQNSINGSPFQFVRSCSEMFGKRMNLKMSVPHWEIKTPFWFTKITPLISGLRAPSFLFF